MRIIEVIPSLGWRAGAEVFCCDLSVEFSKKGHEVIVVSLYNEVHESFVKKLNDNGVKIISLNKKKGIDFKCAKQFKQIVNSFVPDIIHLHLSSVLTYYLAFGLRKRIWKTYLTVHNIASKEANGLNAKLRKIYLKKNRIQMIAISDLIAKTIVDKYGVSPVTIYNGANLNHDLSKANVEYDFICVARFSEQKNHSLLFESFRELCKKNTALKLLCVGGGELQEHYKTKIIEYNLSSNIKIIDPIDNVYDVLKKSKIFILTSRYEGNPISILEAMSCGLPIIAPRVGGIPDIVHDGINGYTFDIDKKDQLLCCFDKILSNKEDVEMMKNNNLSDSKKYSIELCSNKYIDTFLSDSKGVK